MTGSDLGVSAGSQPAGGPGAGAPAERSANPPRQGKWSRLRAEWDKRLDPGQQSVVLSWAAFTTTFVGLRALTHWIRDGHGPSGCGMSFGGQHFHHYNIGIAMLGVVGAVGGARSRQAPASPGYRRCLRIGHGADRRRTRVVARPQGRVMGKPGPRECRRGGDRHRRRRSDRRGSPVLGSRDAGVDIPVTAASR